MPCRQRSTIATEGWLFKPGEHVVFESYDELNKYLAAVESRVADACAGFQRILRDTGGHLVLTPVPAQLQQEHTPFSTNPTITVEPPRSYHRAH
jgi:hypothetical protein